MELSVNPNLGFTFQFGYFTSMKIIAPVIYHYIFTFQFGYFTSYHDRAFFELVQYLHSNLVILRRLRPDAVNSFIPNLHSNLVILRLCRHLHIYRLFYKFTFQFGYFTSRNVKEIMREIEVIYIPIWLFYVYKNMCFYKGCRINLHSNLVILRRNNHQ